MSIAFASRVVLHGTLHVGGSAARGALLLHEVRSLVGEHEEAVGRLRRERIGAEEHLAIDGECQRTVLPREQVGFFVGVHTDVGEGVSEGTFESGERRRRQRLAAIMRSFPWRRSLPFVGRTRPIRRTDTISR